MRQALLASLLIGTTCSLLGFLVCTALLLVNKELKLTTVDPLHGESIGLSAERMRYLLLILLP